LATKRSDDELFEAAVSALDAGDVGTLERMLLEHPQLASTRLEHPGAWLRDKIGNAADGFFARPYLLWFIAEDPVRNGTLPANIAEVAGAIIAAINRVAPETLPEQLKYALDLVAWSWIADQRGVQIPLIDVLMDAGADADGAPENALVNRHERAAAHLVARGAKLNLATALILGRWEDAARIAPATTDRQRQFALVLSALNGKAAAVRWLIEFGVDVNAPSEDLYAHGMPLHHAVCSGDLETVRALVEAGADLSRPDKAWQGTPLGWAEHYVSENPDGERFQRYSAIERFLRRQGAP
jgi:Ankyrin repeats (3 copies)